MERLKKIRKDLGVPQKDVAKALKISQAGYALIEKRGCKPKVKKQIIFFLMPECHKKDIKKSRLAELVGVHRCNLSKYKGDTSEVILKEYEYRMQLRNELIEMLKLC